MLRKLTFCPVILVSLYLQFFSGITFGQDRKSNVDSLLKIADSVVITRHISLRIPYKYGTYDRATKTKHPDTAEIVMYVVIDGRLNDSLITTKKGLSKNSIKQLGAIFTKISRIEDYDHLFCYFDPHHTIAIYKNGKMEYMDLCLKCQQVVHSKNVYLGEFGTFSVSQWQNLKLFFIKLGFINKK